jgi:hypothetical protein
MLQRGPVHQFAHFCVPDNAHDKMRNFLTDTHCYGRLVQENALLKQQLAASQAENQRVKLGMLPETATSPIDSVVTTPSTPPPITTQITIPSASASAPHSGMPSSNILPAGILSATAPTTMHSVGRTSVALATVFAIGLLFTGMDLRPESLPVRHGFSKTSSSLAPYEGVSGRRAGGRVLLGASPEYGKGDGAWEGIPDKKQLLIVTLLDHLISGQMMTSPSLFSRLCNRLKGMGVLDSCAFMESMDKVHFALIFVLCLRASV